MPVIEYHRIELMLPGLRSGDSAYLCVIVSCAAPSFILGVAFFCCVISLCTLRHLPACSGDLTELMWAIGGYALPVAAFVLLSFFACSRMAVPQFMSVKRGLAVLVVAIFATVATLTLKLTNHPARLRLTGS